METEINNLFRDVGTYGAIMEVCRSMLVKLKNDGLFDAHTPKNQPYFDAQVNMLLLHPRNIEVYLRERYDEIRFRNHERDKKGKLVKCEAFLAKRCEYYSDAML